MNGACTNEFCCNILYDSTKNTLIKMNEDFIYDEIIFQASAFILTIANWYSDDLNQKVVYNLFLLVRLLEDEKMH